MATTEQIPEYLKPFIARQDITLYTPMDHASWRFILKISRGFFKENAHQKYIDGLKETGISLERIPMIEEMDACLRRFGWRAVAVNGFIPPAIFMEFQSLGILPIACEMRTLDHLAYTPAPDIVHEAAGHAPIIADPEYATYLRNYGEVSRKAIFSSEDLSMFEAIRNLSVVKEDPNSSEDDIATAEKELETASKNISYISEAAELARMNWWTVEYGLVGSMKSPKIYGAGLLSSVGESYGCLNENVTKHELTADCVNVPYDITRPQPQLFVTPSFQHLTEVLDDYAKNMAYRKGGMLGLVKALQAKTVTTTVLDSGIQISGVLENFVLSEKDGESPQFLKFSGPVQLSTNDAELPAQGPEHHKEGFSSPLGKILPLGKCLSLCTDEEIKSLGDTFKFESGITLKGTLQKITRHKDKVVLLTFDPCTITRKTTNAEKAASSAELPKEEFLYKPEWGVFDLACGSKVVSVFGGAADRKNYLTKTGGLKPLKVATKCNLTEENRALNELYIRVRILRERNPDRDTLFNAAADIVERLRHDYPNDWLLRLEVLELLRPYETGESKAVEAVRAQFEKDLDAIAKTRKDREALIRRGREAYLP